MGLLSSLLIVFGGYIALTVPLFLIVQFSIASMEQTLGMLIAFMTAEIPAALWFTNLASDCMTVRENDD